MFVQVGVADDGRFVAVARFESAEAADRNSERRSSPAGGRRRRRSRQRCTATTAA